MKTKKRELLKSRSRLLLLLCGCCCLCLMFLYVVVFLAGSFLSDVPPSSSFLGGRRDQPFQQLSPLVQTTTSVVVSSIRRTREKEREKDLERIHERRKERERDDDDDVHHDDKNDKKQTTIFIADCEESSTKRRRLFRVALTLAHTNGGSEKRRPGQTEIFTVHDLLFHPPSAANVRHAAAERARKRRSAVVTQSESARESRSESVAFVPAVEFRRREQTSTREDARV